MRDPTEVNVVAREIKRYLAAHPDAADTIDGLMQWWLPHDCAALPRETVEQALAVLVAEGEIVSRTLVDGTVIYARHR